MRRAQHAPTLSEVERLDRFVEGEPADPPLLQRCRASGVGHEEIPDRDPFPFLLMLDGSQAPNRPRAPPRLFAHLAQRGDGAGFSILEVPLGKYPPVARSAGL